MSDKVVGTMVQQGIWLRAQKYQLKNKDDFNGYCIMKASSKNKFLNKKLIQA